MDKVVSVITGDGRNIVVSIIEYWMCSILQGMMKGFDQTVNIMLSDSHERVYCAQAGIEQVALGLYIIRGDNM